MLTLYVDPLCVKIASVFNFLGPLLIVRQLPYFFNVYHSHEITKYGTIYDAMEEFLAKFSDPGEITPLVMLIALWSLPWKGVALWKASQNKSKGWFVALLLINTAAFLDALYIFYFSKKTSSLKETSKK